MKKVIILLVVVLILGVILMRSCNTAEEQDSNLSSTEAVQVVAYSEQTSDGYVVYTNSDKKEKINFSRCSEYAKRLLENYIINNNFSEKKPEDIEWVLRENHAVVYYLVDEQWWVFKLEGDNFKTIKHDSDRMYCGIYISQSKSQEAKYIDEYILEKNAITDKDFMKYLHKWSKINIKKVYIVKDDYENESLNIYYKCDGRWYFCKKAISLKTIKDNEMLDSSIIEKIEESIE